MCLYIYICVCIRAAPSPPVRGRCCRLRRLPLGKFARPIPSGRYKCMAGWVFSEDWRGGGGGGGAGCEKGMWWLYKDALCFFVSINHVVCWD